MIYLVIGAIIYRLIDADIKTEYSFYEIILFCFTTLTTTGYGRIVPKNKVSMIFTIIFSIIGIPLCMLTIANIAKYFERCYWFTIHYMKTQNLNKTLLTYERITPLRLIITFLLIISLSTILDKINGWETFINIYICVISFTTVGFGDYTIDDAKNILDLILTIVFLICGMAIVSIIFTSIQYHFNKIYFTRRKTRYEIY